MNSRMGDNTNSVLWRMYLCVMWQMCKKPMQFHLFIYIELLDIPDGATTAEYDPLSL